MGKTVYRHSSNATGSQRKENKWVVRDWKAGKTDYCAILGLEEK